MKNYLIIISTALTSSILTAALVSAVLYFNVLLPMRKEAVDRGFATWQVTDNATGATKFGWNEIDQTVHEQNPDIFDKIAQPLAEK
jgi:hypothetical protein